MLENCGVFFFFFKQKTAYEMRISDWSSDVCSSEDVMLTLDDNYSRQKIRSDNFGYGIWFNQGSLRNVDLDENGTVLDLTQDGSQTDCTAGTARTYLETNQPGLKLKWNETEKDRKSVR